MQTRQAYSLDPDPRSAIRDIAAQLGESPDAVLLFCSPAYDLGILGPAIAETFACPVAGCTSAGHIGRDGFRDGGITALAFSGGDLSIIPHVIHPLDRCTERAVQIADRVQQSGARFGLLFVDGLSKSEERVASALHQAIDNVPLIGASAGDDLLFQRTCIYHDGRFLSDAALFCAVRTPMRVATFKFQHIVPGERRVVITDADPEERVIREIDGLPAAERYAELVGVDPSELDGDVFLRHPLVLKVDEDSFVRSIAGVGANQSLNCFCAVDTGMVLSLGRALDPVAAIESAFARASERVGTPHVILGMDCITRRLEFKQSGMLDRIGALLAANRVFGFSTYGEQFNSYHVNQTFTGVAIGE
ncbi:MAG TPA: FIST N-terminal domain-containing protein [Rudaea sp.]